MDSVKFYCDDMPKVGEIVRVVFTERKDDHTEGNLIDYEGSIIMIHSQATKKKKIKSWNKVIPLNTTIPAVIEDFDEVKRNGNVSRAYLEDADDSYKSIFFSNSKILHGIFQTTQKFEIDFKLFWEQKMFPFLKKYNDSIGLNNKLYLDILKENFDNLNEITDNEEIISNIKETFTNISLKKEIFKEEIGIISNEGVELIKELIKQTLEEYEGKDGISIKYKNTPNYTVESNSSTQHLRDFIELLKSNSEKKNNIFVKIF